MSIATTARSDVPGFAGGQQQGTGGVPLIPLRETVFGPLVGKRVRRFAAIMLAVYAAGLLCILLGPSPGWVAFGVGLHFPGAGFLYAGGWLGILFFALTLLLFGVAFIAWFASGMMVAPPVVWLAAALLAAAFAGPGAWGWVSLVVPVAVAAGAALGWRRRVAQHREELARARDRNEFLATAAPAVRDGAIEAGPEMSLDELGSARYLLELGLQPVDQFEGFYFLEQFQSASLRYQVDYVQYGLALMQYTRTPAFRGYLQQAQINLIEKKLDKRCWGYWFWENLWGNFDPNPDPIVRDNIMYSGNTAMMIGLYETVNQDDRFSRPGSMTFRWNDRRAFPHDFHTMCDALVRNYHLRDIGLMPCEPNWLYNMCNCIGLTALVMHDRLYETRYFNDVFPRVQQSLNEEFLTGDGRCVAIRSSRIGITLPGLTSTISDSNFIWYQNTLDPGHADRLWNIVRRDFARLKPDGSLDLTLVGPDLVDIGNYRKGSDMCACTILMEAAAEMGDMEMWGALKRHIEGTYGPVTDNGVRRFDGASVTLNIIYPTAMFARPNGWRDLVRRGLPDAWQRGPLLAGVKYPDVLVARAVSDGEDLDLVLRPGNGACQTRLELERLVPGRRYTVRGAEHEFTADAQGRASLDVALTDRLALHIVPQA